MSVRCGVYPVCALIDGNSIAIKSPTALADTSVAPYYSAGFSPGAGWDLLSYEGLSMSFQKPIVSYAQVDTIQS